MRCCQHCVDTGDTIDTVERADVMLISESSVPVPSIRAQVTEAVVTLQLVPQLGVGRVVDGIINLSSR